MNPKPILITGSHRSGSTWVGKMLDLSPSVGYVDEPFNPLDHRPGICSVQFAHWFYYITPENEQLFYEKIKDTVSFSYSLKEELKAIKSTKDALRMARDYINFYKYRISGARPLFKDPIAVLSAEWLASKFDMDVVVMIRHPAAFASSLKMKNWQFDFSDFLEQPLLMRDHLYPFEDEMKEHEKGKRDVIDQAILLWKIIHYMIVNYQNEHKDWIFIRHEDISREPIHEFKNLYENLGIEFSENIKECINKYSSSENPGEIPKTKPFFSIGRSFEFKRDSKLNIKSWKNRLTSSEMERIRSQVESISSVFYSDDDWK